MTQALLRFDRNREHRGRLADAAFLEGHAEAGRIVLTVAEPHVAVPAILEKVRAGGWELSGLSTRHASLEDVFVSLTGRHLRDE